MTSLLTINKKGKIVGGAFVISLQIARGPSSNSLRKATDHIIAHILVASCRHSDKIT